MKTARITARRGGLAPVRTVRPRYSHAASMATPAVASVNTPSHRAGRKTSTITNGIRTRAVRTRFIPRLRIHLRGWTETHGTVDYRRKFLLDARNIFLLF